MPKRLNSSKCVDKYLLNEVNTIVTFNGYDETIYGIKNNIYAIDKLNSKKKIPDDYSTRFISSMIAKYVQLDSIHEAINFARYYALN